MKRPPPPLSLRVWLIDALLDPETGKRLSEAEWAWIEAEVREVVALLLAPEGGDLDWPIDRRPRRPPPGTGTPPAMSEEACWPVGGQQR